MNVVTDANGTPLGLKGQGKDVRVRCTLDHWRYGGRWWLSEAPRDYYLLELETSHVVEVFRQVIGASRRGDDSNLAKERWILSRIAD